MNDTENSTVDTPTENLSGSMSTPDMSQSPNRDSVTFGETSAAGVADDLGVPSRPVLREKLHLADLTFSIVFLIVGLAAIAAAFEAKISLWELFLGLLGAAGVVLLIGAFFTARK